MSARQRVFAIASLLNPAADKTTHELWQWLEWDCGLKGIRLTPTPHFSWLGAEGYDHPRVPIILERFAAEMRPFRVKTAGLGVFTGPNPVLFLPLVKTREMLDIHEQLWRLITPYANQPNPYYDPHQWIPHITLANRDVTPENLACAVNGLLYQSIEFEILVDHLVLIYLIDREVGMVSRFDFKRSR